MDSNKSTWQSLIDSYHSAENFLADTPIAKAIGGVISNPTPQEVGAQAVNLGKDISKGIQQFTDEARTNPVLVGGMTSPLSLKAISALKLRGIKGDALEDIKDLAQEIKEVGGKINDDGTVDLFHRTTPESASNIVDTGKMTGKEDRLFFGTNPTGEISGYGKAIVKAKLPIEKLEIDDIFDNEAHLTYSKPKSGILEHKFEHYSAEDFLDKD